MKTVTNVLPIVNALTIGLYCKMLPYHYEKKFIGIVFLLLFLKKCFKMYILSSSWTVVFIIVLLDRSKYL